MWIDDSNTIGPEVCLTKSVRIAESLTQCPAIAEEGGDVGSGCDYKEGRDPLRFRSVELSQFARPIYTVALDVAWAPEQRPSCQTVDWRSGL